MSAETPLLLIHKPLSVITAAMKTFLKWIARGGIFLAGIVLILYITGQVKVGFSQILLILAIGATAFGVFFYLIEEKYFPYRKKQVMRKVLKLFDAQELGDARAQFKVGNIDVIADVRFVLSLSQYSIQGEIVSFHIPRNSIGAIQLTRPLSQIEESISGQTTYRIYQTYGIGLKLAKRRIDKRFAKN